MKHWEQTASIRGWTKPKLILSLALLTAAATLILYITFSWFVNQATLNTVAKIQVPAQISILKTDHSALEQIDLSYEASEVNGTKVTLKRPVCIESSSNYYLELAHTTNIDGFTCEIYPAEKDASGNYIKKTGAAALNGAFLNQSTIDTTIAAGSEETNSLHSETYGTETNVQKNAEPLYWQSRAQTASDGEQSEDGDANLYYNYYVLEIEWDSATKETDMLYLMAVHTGAVS